MKRLLVLSLFALASLAFVPSALSAQPTIQRFPIDTTFVDTVDCAFPVQTDVTGTELDITVANRVFEAFPNSRVTLTNLDTGKTLTVSIAGPAHITIGADGSVTDVGTGPALFGNLFLGTPGITLINGRVVITFDPEGNVTISDVSGQTRDLCAELAG